MALSEFGKAFAAARKAGDKEFTFNGKQYNTRLKEDTVGGKNAKEGMSMTRMDPEKGAEAKHMFDLENARDRALSMAADERAAAAAKARKKDEAEAAAAASLGGYKRGGSVKSSASRRGDGIATKGKTRGKLC